MKFDRKTVRELAEILNDTDLTEIEIEEKDLKIRVSRTPAQAISAPVQMAMPQQMPMASAAPQAAQVIDSANETAAAMDVVDASHPGALTSPMVGTAYMAPEPGAANFVSVGDKVNEGDTILIVEAMKVMNPIKATQGGMVKQLLTSDGQPVEFGDVLAVIE
jgi:acetyl-CoA carboxylase biotin carboxyl carrier protein